MIKLVVLVIVVAYCAHSNGEGTSEDGQVAGTESRVLGARESDGLVERNDEEISRGRPWRLRFRKKESIPLNGMVSEDDKSSLRPWLLQPGERESTEKRPWLLQPGKRESTENRPWLLQPGKRESTEERPWLLQPGKRESKN